MAKQKTVMTLLLPALCLFMVCLVTTTLLAITNETTAPIIERNLRAEANRLYRIVVPGAEQFEEKKIELEGKSYTIQVALAGGKTIGYVFNTQMNGYGGPVVCLTGVTEEGKISGVQILNMTETAGLGMNAEKPEFIDQYKDKSKLLRVVKNEAQGEEEIQAISGATITSNAVTGSVNTALKLFEQVQGGGKK